MRCAEISRREKKKNKKKAKKGGRNVFHKDRVVQKSH
jgi:hypothetical protein